MTDDVFDEADRKRLDAVHAAVVAENDVGERERRNAEYQLLKIDLAAKHRRGNRDNALGDDAESGGP